MKFEKGSYLIVALLSMTLLVACEVGPGPGAEGTTSTATTLVKGYVSVGKGLPVVGATVRFEFPKSTDTGFHINLMQDLTAETGLSGEYLVDTQGRQPSGLIVAVATGGTIQGEPVAGSLRAIHEFTVAGNDWISINPITTVAERWHNRNPKAKADEALRQAKLALGLPEWTDADAATRVLDTLMGGAPLLAEVKASGGFTAWADKIALDWAGGITNVYPPASNGAGPAIAGAIAWTMVSSAAASCDPSESAVPGLGMLASAINRSGFIKTDPACDLKKISDKITDIKKQLDSMEEARAAQESALASMLERIIDNENKIAWSAAKRDYENMVGAYVRRAFSNTRQLADSIQTHTQQCGLSLDNLLQTNPSPCPKPSSTLASDQRAREIRVRAAEVLEVYGTDGWKIHAVDYPQQQFWDVPGMGIRNLFHLAWLAANDKAFIDASQQATFSTIVTYFRQLNILRAVQEIDYRRNKGDSSETLIGAMKDWAPGDADFERLLPLMLPVGLEAIPGPIRGKDLQLPAVPPTGPVLDPDTGLIWIAACTQYWNGNGNNVDPNYECPYRGIMGVTAKPSVNANESFYSMLWRGHGFQIRLPGQGSLPMASVGPVWAQLAAQLVEAGSTVVPALGRPSVAQMQTLRDKALAAGRSGPAVGKWLAENGAGVFYNLDTLPAWTNVWYGNCNWFTGADHSWFTMCGDGAAFGNAVRMFDVNDGNTYVNSPSWEDEGCYQTCSPLALGVYGSYCNYCDATFTGPEHFWSGEFCDFKESLDLERTYWDFMGCASVRYTTPGPGELVDPGWLVYSTRFFGPTTPAPHHFGEWAGTGTTRAWKPYDPAGVALGVTQVSQKLVKKYVPSNFVR